VIYLTPLALANLNKAALSAYPLEACGFLLGLVEDRHQVIKLIIPGQDGQAASYLLSAEELLAAEETAKTKKLTVLGFYHSHPDGQAYPSRRDHEDALPGYIYGLVSTTNAKTDAWVFYQLEESVGLLMELDSAIESPPNQAPLAGAVADLEPRDLARYRSHLLLPEVGREGQKKLKAARVLVVGAGGLGSPIAYYLAAAGVGTIGLVDDDQVELTNLQRQILFDEKVLGRSKTDSAKTRLMALNSQIKIQTYPTRLNRHNALEILKGWDLICDATDNFPTRYLLNDAAAFLGLPLVYGSIHQFEGQASVFWAKHGPCYRCLFPTPPRPESAPSCGQTGVMGSLPGIIGTIQATEAIKLIVGGSKTLLGRLLLVDAWIMEFTDMPLEKDHQCPVCGERPTITELIDYELFCGDIPQGLAAPGFSHPELRDRLDNGPPIQVIDIREPQERELYPWPNAIPIPYVELTKRLGELDPLVDAVVICEIGQRSLFAIRALKKAGYPGKLYNLKEGTKDWAKNDPNNRDPK
jgi:adenylyltransferase/sulfurtransferase